MTVERHYVCDPALAPKLAERLLGLPMPWHGSDPLRPHFRGLVCRRATVEGRGGRAMVRAVYSDEPAAGG